MKLTRLELSGFKSFADNIELPFEEGITCIVGPNGCGKSNVSDSVRWVLGEQRARMLRGSKMEEVIFQGSIKRKPLNLAQVSLYFDNDDGILPVPYREVAITRRLSRGGQSDYLLNQSPTRLKDVQDLLRGTGLGSDAGVVIEARMIDRLLSDKAEERRSLFEEAAGIGLYRDRKIITERRLEKTLDDLQRLDDLISEVHTQVRSLARQRGKAERHHKFRQERFVIVMELARRQLGEIETERDTIKADRERISVEAPATRERLAAQERDRETRIQQRASAEAKRTELERRLADRRLEVERLEGDLKLAVERLENARGRKARAHEERSLAEAAASKAQLELDAASEEWEAAKEARESVQIELDLRTASEDETRTRLTRHRDGVREMEDKLQAAAERHRALAGEQQALEAELVDLRQQASALEQRLAEARAAAVQAHERGQRAENALAAAEAADRTAAAELDRIRHELSAAREHETAVTIERRNADETVTQLDTRREALEALERDRAGLAPAARQLLAARDRFSPGAIHGPLVDFLSASTEGAQIAERYLADWLHAVLVRDETAVEEVQRWHAETRPGPLVLLPLEPGPVGPTPAVQESVRVDAAEPARAWAESLLAGHKPLGHDTTAVRRPNGAIFLAGGDESTGPLRRRAELESLVRQLEDAEATRSRLEVALREATQRRADAEQGVLNATTAAETARAAFLEAKGAADDAARELQRAEREVHETETTHTRLAERVSDRTTRRDRVVDELQSVERNRAGLDAELAHQRTLLTNMEGEQEAAREKRVHWQVEEAQVSARERAALDRTERARAALDQARSDMDRLVHELEHIDESTTGLSTQQSEWTDRLGERRVEVTELEQAAREAERGVAEATAALTQCEQELQSLRERAAELSEAGHRFELRETELRGRRQALVERLEVEWHRPFDELLAGAPDPLEGETDALTAEAERLANAIDAMGPVNPLAAQEYEEEKQRLEFLQTQRDDTAEARGSLEQSLKEIDQTARQLFREAFDAIRDNFQRVFHTLFEGGECDVALADETDPLDSEIEIRAAPRGKRTQRIHLLSSGERALVALSLLFAIYLAKPSPFCLLDEVDAPLDDANVQRFIRLLTEFKDDTQFIVITHNPRTMQVADAVYGVTMQEPGVSTIVGVRLGEHQVA